MSDIVHGRLVGPFFEIRRADPNRNLILPYVASFLEAVFCIVGAHITGHNTNVANERMEGFGLPTRKALAG
jgi:hypothetical protein